MCMCLNACLCVSKVSYDAEHFYHPPMALLFIDIFAPWRGLLEDVIRHHFSMLTLSSFFKSISVIFMQVSQTPFSYNFLSASA